ncbi:MAG: hypothetical protein ACREQL_07240, partial [Candidatus Binatia bacterium]
RSPSRAACRSALTPSQLGVKRPPGIENRNRDRVRSAERSVCQCVFEAWRARARWATLRLDSHEEELPMPMSDESLARLPGEGRTHGTRVPVGATE